MCSRMTVRVGIDLVSVQAVQDALHAHRDSYLSRVYTDREVTDCRTADGMDAERLAARFAAKEAALKVLRPRDGGIPWSAIEVRRDPGGWVEMELSGAAADLAEAAGVAELAVSLSHEGGFASAVVIAELRPSSR
jgi:holo-[acyl-carrier protein] synthase